MKKQILFKWITFISLCFICPPSLSWGNPLGQAEEAKSKKAKSVQSRKAKPVQAIKKQESLIGPKKEKSKQVPVELMTSVKKAESQPATPKQSKSDIKTITNNEETSQPEAKEKQLSVEDAKVKEKNSAPTSTSPPTHSVITESKDLNSSTTLKLPVNSPPPFHCSDETWILGDASLNEGTIVSFNPAWDELLKNIARCEEYMLSKKSCLRVQGHYDNHPFSPDIVRVFGTQELAQVSRAQGRAQSVIKRLQALGLDDTLIISRNPPLKSTFRGVLIDMGVGCFRETSAVNSSRPSKEEIQKARKEEQERQEANIKIFIQEQELAKEKERQRLLAQKRSKPKSAHSFWTQIFLNGLYLNQHKDLFGMQTQGQFGWTYKTFYMKASGLVATMSHSLYQLSYGAQFGSGWHHSWVDLGFTLGHQRFTKTIEDPIGIKLDYLGLESQKCLWPNQKYSLCFRGLIAPLTHLSRQVSLEDQQLVRINTETSHPLLFELGVGFRYTFGKSNQ